MFAFFTVTPVRAAMVALALTVAAPAVQAQQPSPAAVTMAKELIALKGATSMFDPLVLGVIEKAKGMFQQSNPTLAKDLTEVANKLRAEYAPRIAEVHNLVARIYASHFTEKELKDALVFYKSPLGKKLIEQEPVVLEQSMGDAQAWANKLSEEIIGKIRAEMKRRGHEI